MQYQTPGQKVCRFHGGKSTGRPVKAGRWSKALGKLAGTYEETLADPSLLELKEPIAVLDTLAKTYTERIGEGDTVDLRARALKLFDRVEAAHEAADLEAMSRDLKDLGTLLRDGVATDKAIRNMSEQVERLSRVVKMAWDVKLAKKSAINAKDLVAVVARFVDIVRECTDLDTARKVADRMNTEMAIRN